METKFDTTEAVKICKTLSEKNKVLVKVLKCEQNDQGLTFYYLTPERSDLRPLSRDLNRHFKIKINFKELTTSEAASLIPGYGPCGTRISWMTDACDNLWDCTCDPTVKTQDAAKPEGLGLPNPSGLSEPDTDQTNIGASPFAVSKNQESRGVKENDSHDNKSKETEPTKENKKKFVRRLVLK